MAVTNHERVGKTLELLKDGLVPFVEREMKAQHAQLWFDEAKAAVSDTQADLFKVKDKPRWDAAALLIVMWNKWNDVFKKTLGQAERTLVSELREVRNRWAHQQTFSTDDAYRALDSAARLLTAVSAPQAAEIERMKTELLRLRFDEQVRSEKRKAASAAIESNGLPGLKPWREVVVPHKDVASGQYQQAEFAADLWQVSLGEGAPEYRDPVEFFRRTFLTESLKRMLVSAVKRLSGTGGDPVIQLQTNFGGGKTHSMIALYHLFSKAAPSELPGVESVMQEAKATNIPAVHRVVIVGNRISPGNPVTKKDGTVVRTLWGEIAWQLGGKKAYARVKADDEKATSPGDVLRELFNEYSPCLILIDEWVAYARQLHDVDSLPAGSFETQFTFAQALTESVRLAKNCLLVISLPASDSPVSPHAQADDSEVGGQRGREALDRLRHVVGRLETSWRPASGEEGFEIVRRRLFEPMTDPSHYRDRDVVARAFADLYRTQHQVFPPECHEIDYEKRIRAAYPIHPEVFERLYTDWSTLLKFQRTRGVLRLMAAVINALWEKGDKNPLIMPAHIAIDDARVQSELTRYLSDNWTPIIEKDVDGPGSLPFRIDGEVTNLGKFAACRRVARVVYLGSAPIGTAAHRGIEDRRIHLGCVMPGESPNIFGDALRRLATSATYLYQDGSRYWYSTQPTVTKMAEDRAEQLTRDSDKVVHEMEERIRENLRQAGDFRRVHAFPLTSQDVPDEPEARLVVLRSEAPYSKEAGNEAEKAARDVLQNRGNTPRLYQNTLVFLAADKSRLKELDESVRRFLAWDSIVSEKLPLNLDPNQVKQAETQRKSAEAAVLARLPETYQWLLVPEQKNPQVAISWNAIKLSGQDPLAVRASKRLRNDELLITVLAATRLKLELDQVPLWRGNHVSIRQLVEDYARYVYLSRLAGPDVLVNAAKGGIALLTWEHDTFAFAEDFDEAAGRYRGLSCGQRVEISSVQPAGLLVKPDVARKQLDAETATARPAGAGGEAGGSRGGVEGGPAAPGSGGAVQPQPVPAQKLTRFHGSVDLAQNRVGRDAGRIAEEVISHLAGLVGAKVRVTLDIEAEVPAGVPESVVRTVTENARTLKFTNQGFEKE